MHISTDIKDFVPKNFVINNFYGKDTCFAWGTSDEFVTFPYVYNDSTVASKFLKSPAKIKDIRELNGRTFVLCFPRGIYKLTEKLEFATFSKTGLELVSEFCILTLSDRALILEDKTLKSTVKLLSLSAISSIYVLPLRYNNTDNSFYKALSVDECKSDMNLCLLAVDKKLFKLVNQTLQLIYESNYLIKSIVTFEKQNQVFGALLQTDSSTVVLVHAVENKLIYDTVFLNVNVLQTVYPVLCTSKKNSVLLVYSGDTKTYYSNTILTTNAITEIKLENQIFLSIKLYQSSMIVCLDDSSNLFQFSIGEIRNFCEEGASDYVGLQSNMLKGLESVIDIICEKTQELKILREDMLKKEDCLKRINVFVNKQTIKYCPNDSVLRLLNHLFLISNFKKSLFENSTVVRVLKSRGKIMFLMKDVHDYDTIVEMPVNLSNLSSKLYTTTDLITYKSNSGIWCLLKNYVQDPLPSNKSVLARDQLDIVKYNLVVLKNLIKENNISVERLSEIKRKIRHAIELDEL